MSYTKAEVLYNHDVQVHNLNAPREVVPLLMRLTNPRSVLDVGCGIGTWLKAFEEAGVTDIVGVDGDYVNRDLLLIEKENFLSHDLRKYFNLNRTFDLVICLEVAEHLPENTADQLVDILCKHGRTIVFSAAIPGQIGQNHINEQWPTYWKAKFEKRGFYFHDAIRPLIWTNSNVDLWYKQNMFLVTREQPRENSQYISLVHPDMLSVLYKTQEEYRDSLLLGKQGLRIAARIFMNSLIFKIKSIFKS